MKKKLSLRALLDNNSFLMALSLVLAILIWIAVIYNVDSTIPKIIRNIPVTINTNDPTLQRLGLAPVTDKGFTVDVELVGNRSTVGNISPDELIVTAKLNNITAPGTYDLALEIEDTRNRDLEIKATVPDILSLRFDHVVKKTLPILLDRNNVKIPEGYILDQEYLYPTEVEITGPATEMEGLTSASVSVDVSEEKIGSISQDRPIVLKNAAGVELSSPYLKKSAETVSINLPILKKKTVPITFDFINIPEGFDVKSLECEIDPEVIEIAAPDALLPNVNEMHLGYIDLRTLSPNVTYSYSVSLPPQFISVEDLTGISITYNPISYAEKTLVIPAGNIYAVNTPSHYSVDILSKTIPNVVVYGPEKDIATLTAKDLVAEIDLAEAEIQEGQITLPINIILPNERRCWAYGDQYTARVSITEKK